MRCLLIEDERKVSDFVSRGLRAERFAIDVAYDGDSGWDFASRYEYDLIILDLMLPGLTGTEVLERIRAERNRPQADLWWGAAHTTFQTAADENLLAVYKPIRIP